MADLGEPPSKVTKFEVSLIKKLLLNCHRLCYPDYLLKTNISIHGLIFGVSKGIIGKGFMCFVS